MEKQEKKFYEKWWFWVIVAFIVICILGGSSSLETQNNTQNISSNTVEAPSEEKVIFLRGSNGKDFFNILCEVAEVTPKDGVDMGDSIIYASSNEKYGVELETNKNNEINWISIYTLLSDKNDYENFFIAISRLEYNNSNTNELFNWIHDNLGKEASIKIGDANFKLYNGTSGNPILEVFTDGNEDFQKEQLDKLN